MKGAKVWIVLLALLICFGGESMAAERFKVKLDTTPSASDIGPDKDFVRTVLTVKDAQGNLVPRVYIRIHLYAPPKKTFFSTDFPWVEGTSLMSYAGYINNGRFAFQYIYPIRGIYRFDVDVGREPDHSMERHVLQVSVRENPEEGRNLFVLLALLSCLGIVSGRMIKKGSMVKKGCLMWVVLGWTLGTPLKAYADHPGLKGEIDAHKVPPVHEEVAQKNMRLGLTVAPGVGKVGMMNELVFKFTNSKGQPLPNTLFEVILWHQEDAKPVFSTTVFAKDGFARLGFQFFDGAEHEVRVRAVNAVGSLEVKKTIEVQALQPPLSTKFKTVGYFVLWTFFSILIGFQLTPRHT